MGTTTDKGVLAWHFLRDDRTLGYQDKRVVRDGETLKASYLYAREDKPTLCKAGMHASRNILDALQWAPGNVICRVRVGGLLVEGDDKLAGDWRKCIWSVDGEKLLRRFARWSALQVAHLWDMPPIVKRWLVEDREANRDAARDAAWNAARDTARYAARYAARDAAWYAAWYAVRDAAEKELLRLVTAAHKGEMVPQRIARSEWPA